MRGVGFSRTFSICGLPARFQYLSAASRFPSRNQVVPRKLLA